jgi:hypothetical protein
MMSVPLGRRPIIWSLIGAALLAPIFWMFYRPAGGLYDVSGFHLGRDFLNMWSGPQILSRYGVMTLFDINAYHAAQSELAGRELFLHNWGYPLHLFFFIYPLSFLPYLVSLAIWTLVGWAAYLAVAASAVEPAQRRFAIVILLIAPSTLVNTIAGQNGFFTAALFLSAIALLDRRPWLAGVMVGLLTLKPHLGVLLAPALLALGAWRTITSAAFTAALLIGGSVMIWGAEPWIVFLTRTSAYQYHFLVDFYGFYTFMMTSVFASLRVMSVTPEAAKIIQIAVSLAVILTTVITVRRTTDIALRALLLTSGTFLASPYVFNYDMPMLTAALLWFMLSKPPKAGENLFLACAWIAPAAVWGLHIGHYGIVPLMFGGVFLIAVMRIYQGAPQEAVEGAPDNWPKTTAVSISN